jgi:hypothetical protein
MDPEGSRKPMHGSTGTDRPAGTAGTVPGQDNLVVAVARLLAVAVSETNRHRTVVAGAVEDLPDYWSWPMLELPWPTDAGRVRFYVCPTGVLASEEECFPIGTQFVMERSNAQRRDVFVMTRCAARYASAHEGQEWGRWLCARCVVACKGGIRSCPVSEPVNRERAGAHASSRVLWELRRAVMGGWVFQPKEEG